MVSKQETFPSHIPGLSFPGASTFPTQEERDRMMAKVPWPPTCPPSHPQLTPLSRVLRHKPLAGPPGQMLTFQVEKQGPEEPRLPRDTALQLGPLLPALLS